MGISITGIPHNGNFILQRFNEHVKFNKRHWTFSNSSSVDVGALEVDCYFSNVIVLRISLGGTMVFKKNSNERHDAAN